MNDIVRSPPLVYVIFVPRRGEIDVLNSGEFLRMQKDAASDHVHALFSPMNYETLDRLIEKGYDIHTIFSVSHKYSFRAVRRVWIAGSGSSAYAREIIRIAMSDRNNIPVSDYCAPGSCLSRYMNMLRSGKIREGFLAGESRGLMIQG